MNNVVRILLSKCILHDQTKDLKTTITTITPNQCEQITCFTIKHYMDQINIQLQYTLSNKTWVPYDSKNTCIILYLEGSETYGESFHWRQ